MGAESWCDRFHRILACFWITPGGAWSYRRPIHEPAKGTYKKESQGRLRWIDEAPFDYR